MNSPDQDAQDRSEELRLSLLMAAVYAVVGVQLPFFPLWLHSRGLGPAEIGAVMGAPPAFRTISTLVASRRADRTGRHAPMLIAFLAAEGLAYALLALLDGFLPILAGALLLALAQGPLYALGDGIILGAAHRRSSAGRAQLHYSFVRGWGSVSILVCMLASGPLASAIPNAALAWLLAAIAFASAATAFLALRGLGGGRKRERPETPPEKLARPLLVVTIIVATAMIQSSHAMVNSFGSLHWKACGHSEAFVSLAWSTALVTEAGFFLMAGRWFGGESRALSFLLAGGVAALLRWLAMASDPSAFGVIAAQALHGISCAAVQLGPAYLLASLCGAGRFAQAQGWLGAANAAATSLVTFSSGLLYERFGELGYLGMAALATAGFMLAAAAGLALRVRPREAAA
ncbi:MFS transporter [Methylocystis heyeri]|uniref:MFS transporter n=1 Tax=Methylocystis heyeri TaxID=391905 RepID=A0A6B8KCE6_9HYPH|nr:MFS transporter [Methylocystis heyeri]QGM45896.1 MFS transporter [Methylocystis heyeri]